MRFKELAKKVGKRIKSEAVGTVKNMGAGLKANFNPSVKGGLGNAASQMKGLVRRYRGKK